MKRSSARSNALVQAQVNEEETPAAPATVTRASKRGKQKEAQGATATPVAEPPATPAAPRTTTKRKSTRKSAATVIDSGAENEATEQGGEAEGRAPSASKAKAKAKAKGKPRKKSKQSQAVAGAEAETANQDGDQEADGQEDEEEEQEEGSESDPELHEIDTTEVTMYEVSNDRKHGKTSEREKEMAAIDWGEVARKEREAVDRAVAAGTGMEGATSQAQQPPADAEIRETTEGPSGTAETPHAESTAAESAANPGAIKFRLDVNNQIVEDEASLTIDRRAQAEAEIQQNTMPVEEENDLTRRINRTTWLNERKRAPAERVPMWKNKSDPWSEEETDKFYDALCMFGTDFFIISKMFHPKTRKQIKHKFTREEKLDPERINAALLGKKSSPRKPIDLEHYSRETGVAMAKFTKYEDAAHAQRVIAEDMKAKEAEMEAAERLEQQEEAQMKEAQAVKEKGKKKAGEKKGKEKEKDHEVEAVAGTVAAKGKGARGKKKRGPATLGGGGPQDTEAGAAEE